MGTIHRVKRECKLNLIRDATLHFARIAVDSAPPCAHSPDRASGMSAETPSAASPPRNSRLGTREPSGRPDCPSNVRVPFIEAPLLTCQGMSGNASTFDRFRFGAAAAVESAATIPHLGRPESRQEFHGVVALDQAQVAFAEHLERADGRGSLKDVAAGRKIGPEHDLVCLHEL